VIAAFTEASGITVKLIFIEGNMVERLTSEGAASPADVLMTIGLDKTTQFSNHDLTQPLVSAILDAAVPSHLRGSRCPMGLAVDTSAHSTGARRGGDRRRQL